MRSSKIAIVVGHNARAQGAVRATDGRTEFDWNGHLARLIQEHDPSNVNIYLRTQGGGYSAEIDRVYRELSDDGCACSVELHFNGSSNPAAHGGVTLSSGTQGSLALARLVRRYNCAALGNVDRGVRTLGRRDRGGRSLWQGKPPAVMIEPYFGSNVSECHRAEMHKDELAEAIFRAAREFVS